MGTIDYNGPHRVSQSWGGKLGFLKHPESMYHTGTEIQKYQKILSFAFKISEPEKHLFKHSHFQEQSDMQKGSKSQLSHHLISTRVIKLHPLMSES